MFENTKIGWKS